MTSIPHGCLCPISFEIMRDPVIAPDGYTYERDAILTWLKSNPISPMTRLPMTLDSLVPNRALQSAIEAFLARNPNPILPPLTPPLKAFISAPVSTTGVAFTGPDGVQYLHVRVSAPTSCKRQPVVLLPIIDNSGSMGESIGAAGGIEETGFTRLDLVKHAVRPMAAILGEDDFMGIITFSSDARIVLTPQRMDDSGKRAIDAALSSITPGACTNIYDGIKKGAALLADLNYINSNIVAMLLTDGFPTINPPRGILHSLTSIIKPARWTLHTFGFGHRLDSDLCFQIAKWGNGLFGFIPDATMVGTVFINTLAHVLSTANLGIDFTYNSESTPVSVFTGPICCGQPRDYLFEVKGETQLNGVSVNTGDPNYVLIYHLYKQTISEAITICKTVAERKGQALLARFELNMNIPDDPIVSALMKDIRASKEGEGQVGLAPIYFTSWGEHYMRAYLRAQELQLCMNFKDPGLQIYGGDLFHSIQDIGDRLFCDLPPPKPSLTRTSAVPQTNMSLFHNASGGCFSAETLIRLPDGRNKIITDLKRGDKVWTPSGPANVVALVVIKSKVRAQPMSTLGSLVITPYHPVRMRGSSEWKFPADIVGYIDRLIPTVYNLVLDCGHIVLADGWEALTLGHGFVDPVAAHPYFGTQRVIEDLKKQPGWDDGRPMYNNLTTIKDDETGFIIGWQDTVSVSKKTPPKEGLN